MNARSARKNREPRRPGHPLATKLLGGEFKPGDRIKVTSNSEGLAFKAK
jgi:hypothetical protein